MRRRQDRGGNTEASVTGTTRGVGMLVEFSLYGRGGEGEVLEDVVGFMALALVLGCAH
jgi:hypothetical protein